MGEKPSVTKSDFENVVDVVLNHGKTRDGDLCPFPDQERRIERYIRHIVGVAYTEIEKRVGKTLLERVLGGLHRFRFSDVKPGLVEDDNGLWVMHDNVVGRITAALINSTGERVKKQLCQPCVEAAGSDYPHPCISATGRTAYLFPGCSCRGNHTGVHKVAAQGKADE